MSENNQITFDQYEEMSLEWMCGTGPDELDTEDGMTSGQAESVNLSKRTQNPNTFMTNYGKVRYKILNTIMEKRLCLKDDAFFQMRDKWMFVMFNTALYAGYSIKQAMCTCIFLNHFFRYPLKEDVLRRYLAPSIAKRGYWMTNDTIQEMLNISKDEWQETSYLLGFSKNPPKEKKPKEKKSKSVRNSARHNESVKRKEMRDRSVLYYYARGVSLLEITRRVGISRNTVRKITRKYDEEKELEKQAKEQRKKEALEKREARIKAEEQASLQKKITKEEQIRKNIDKEIERRHELFKDQFALKVFVNIIKTFGCAPDTRDLPDVEKGRISKFFLLWKCRSNIVWQNIARKKYPSAPNKDLAAQYCYLQMFYNFRPVQELVGTDHYLEQYFFAPEIP